MRILVIGAYGLIGTYVALRLVADGHDVVGLGRQTAAASRRLPAVRWIVGDLRVMTTDEAWEGLLREIEGVVNCAGALQDGPADDVTAVQALAMSALFRACRKRGIRRVIHFSAPPSASGTLFEATKRQADKALAESSLDWLILRPALVLAPQAYGGTALMRGLAALPFFCPVLPVAGSLQIVSIFDVTETVSRAIREPSYARRIYDLAHPARISFEDLIRGIRCWLGLKPVPALRMPGWLTAIAVTGADAAGWLGWRSPARTTALHEISQGITADPTAWIADMIPRPADLHAFLAAMPSTVQERRFALSYFLKPFGLVMLALFWIVSGIVGLGPGRSDAVRSLMSTGLPETMAGAAVLAGSLLDILLGTAALVARTSRPALIGMLLASFAYLVAATILLPGLWLDPFGALLKVLPTMIAVGALLALSPDR
jgi:uncharacterized protein YbjT (DUF2867 family)